MFHSFLHLIEDGSRMDGLTGSIDTPVGIDTGPMHVILTVVIAVLVVGIEFGTSLVILRIGKHLTLIARTIGLQEILTLGICHHIQHMLIGVVLFLDTQMRPCKGLTGRGTYHNIAQCLRLGLHDGINVCDVIEATYRLCTWSGGKLHHIDTYRQTWECQRVLKELIGFLPRKSTGLFGSHTLDELFHLLVAVIIRRRGIEITIGIQTIHLHRDRREVAQTFEFHLLRLLGRHHPMMVRHMILGIGEFLLCIAQNTDSFPTAPLLKGLMDIGDTLCHGERIHPFITGNGEFAAFLQVTVGSDEGIEFLNRRIALHLRHNETGGLSVTCLCIIVVKRLQVV